MNQQKITRAVLFLLFAVGVLQAECQGVQDPIKVGDMIEFYHGGSEYVIRTPVVSIPGEGFVNIQYKTPFTDNGISQATIRLKDFWRVGETPNPAPDNEFKLGEDVEFYFRQTDQVGKGIVSGVLSRGSRYTIHYQSRSGGKNMRASVEPEAIWKKGANPKPLPDGYISLGPQPNRSRVSSAPKPKPIRKWTAANGKFGIEARYLSSTETTVELEKSDGEKMTVELAKLSEPDNEYVANAGNSDLTRREVKGKPEIPFADNRLNLKPGKWDYKPASETATNFSLPQQEVRMAMPVGFGSNRGRGGISWAPLGPGEEANDQSNFQRKEDLDYDFGQWVLAQDGKRCFMMANTNFGQGCLIQGFNFETGELEFFEEIDGLGLGISTDGSKVAFLQTSLNGRSRGELIIKETGPDGSVLTRKVVKSFFDESGYEPSAGFFMNNSTFVTLGRRIVAFDLEQGTGYSTNPFPKGVVLGDAAISPNRKQIAMASSGGVYLFDASRGKPTGAIKVPGTGREKIAFSPDGLKLIHCSQFLGGIKIFDLTTGELTKEIASHGERVTRTIAWPHPRFLLLDNKALFDLELGVVIWRFQPKGSFFDPLFHMVGNTFISNDGATGLTPIQLPLDRIETEISALSIDDATVLKAGDDYRIELNTTFGGPDEQRIRDHFQKQMELRGITLNESSNNVFYCFVETGLEETALIKMTEEDTRTVRFTPTTSKIELEVDGELKWQRKRVNSFSGGTLQGRRGESPQQAVTRLCLPKVSTFSSARLPVKFILFPNGKDVLGESEISSQGVNDVD